MGCTPHIGKKKLKNNKSIEFPDALVDEVAGATERFSFAYLKEAFVSALVTLAGIGDDEEKPSFRSVLMEQIEVLRKQLDKPKEAVKPPISIEGSTQAASSPGNVPLSPISRPLPHPWRRPTQSRSGFDSLHPLQSRYGTGILPGSVQYDCDPSQAHMHPLRVPGGFGGEDDPLSLFVPPLPGSANNYLANHSLPGMSGYWTSR